METKEELEREIELVKGFLEENREDIKYFLVRERVLERRIKELEKMNENNTTT